VTIVFEDTRAWRDVLGRLVVEDGLGRLSCHEQLATVSNDNMSKDVKISVPNVYDTLQIQMRKKLKKVLQTSQVIYTSEKARIIDIPYKSDLEPWLKDGGGFDGYAKMAEALKEARCTLNTCANIHPWSVRGTLHPWKTYQDKDGEANLDLHTGECQICDGYGGKDGGLFTGETLLHIAIVQHDHQMVKWLLDGGASLDVRALGVFFQRPRIDRFTSDQTSFPFTLWPKEQQADNNNFFRYLFQCLNRNTWT
jgi:hypothetical protein